MELWRLGRVCIGCHCLLFWEESRLLSLWCWRGWREWGRWLWGRRWHMRGWCPSSGLQYWLLWGWYLGSRFVVRCVVFRWRCKFRSLTSHWRPNSDSNLLHMLVGRYIKGIVESVYIEIVSGISVIGVVMVETLASIYFIFVNSTTNLRATSL